MEMNSCIKCANTNHIMKNLWLPTRDYSGWLKTMIPSTELFYLKICVNCGYTEMYCAKVVGDNVKKNIKNSI